MELSGGTTTLAQQEGWRNVAAESDRPANGRDEPVALGRA